MSGILKDTYKLPLLYADNSRFTDKFITDSNGKVIFHGVVRQRIFHASDGHPPCFPPQGKQGENPFHLFFEFHSF